MNYWLIEEMRARIEKRLWEEYDPDIAHNMEELTDFIMQEISQALQKQKEEMVEKIKLIMNHKNLPDDVSKEYREMSERYNLWEEQVLEKVIILLEQS